MDTARMMSQVTVFLDGADRISKPTDPVERYDLAILPGL